MEKLTKKQAKVLKFIERYQFKNGASPTVREIREYLGVNSDNAILKHLNGLKAKKYIKRDNTPRGIGLMKSVRKHLELAGHMARVPLLGTIPAGGPVSADEQNLGTYEIDTHLFKSQEGAFLLRVTGNSMFEAGIYDGDMVMVLPEREPRHGDVVVALVDGENTVKRFMRDGNRVYLKADNPAYENIYPQGELQIQGVVSGLIRNY